MKKILTCCLVYLLFLNTLSAQTYLLQPAYPTLSTVFQYPIELKSVPDTSNRMFVVTNTEKFMQFPPVVLLLPCGELVHRPFSIVSQSGVSGDAGLLGLAFHPDYANNGYFYVNYTNSLSGSLNHTFPDFR